MKKEAAKPGMGGMLSDLFGGSAVKQTLTELKDKVDEIALAVSKSATSNFDPKSDIIDHYVDNIRQSRIKLSDLVQKVQSVDLNSKKVLSLDDDAADNVLKPMRSSLSNSATSANEFIRRLDHAKGKVGQTITQNEQRIGQIDTDLLSLASTDPKFAKLNQEKADLVSENASYKQIISEIDTERKLLISIKSDIEDNLVKKIEQLQKAIKDPSLSKVLKGKVKDIFKDNISAAMLSVVGKIISLPGLLVAAGIFTAKAVGAGTIGLGLLIWYLYTRTSASEKSDQLLDVLSRLSGEIGSLVVSNQTLQRQLSTVKKLSDEAIQFLPILNSESIKTLSDDIVVSYLNKIGDLGANINLLIASLNSPELFQSISDPENAQSVKDLSSTALSLIVETITILDDGVDKLSSQANSKKPGAQRDSGISGVSPVPVPGGGRGGAGTSAPVGPLEPRLLSIYDTQVDIAKYAAKSPAFASAAPRIISKVMNVPLGKAFVDPQNYYGGMLGRKATPEMTYLNYLLFFYRNNVDSVGKLRSLIRKSFSRVERGRGSGFKNALKQYRASLADDGFISQSSTNDSHFQKFSNEKQNTINNKKRLMQSDDFKTDDYFKSLMKDLDDSYMKSYYAGLKGMHNKKPESRKSDYADLYQTSDETGTDLMLSAHPKSVELAKAISDGGLIENGIEQQVKTEQILLDIPTGNFKNRYASANSKQFLVKLANDADERGDFKFADLIDRILFELNEI